MADESSGCSIKVVARFRPVNDRERAETAGKESKMVLRFVSANEGEIGADAASAHRFTFDRVFAPGSTQEEVYETVARPTIDDVLAGFNGTIFAYGQTGSGKTYTMMGPDGAMQTDLRGIIPRAAQQLFEAIRADRAGETEEWKIKCSYLEIYLDAVTDLLNPASGPLKVHETPSRGVWVEGLVEEFVTCEQDIYDLLAIGSDNRAVSATKMNQVSSRSHSVFILVLEQRMKDGSTKSGRLNLVDLAGSEKVQKTGASGVRLDEAKMINKTLSALGNVIHALTEVGRSHIPFRDSKLTHILKDSLGGNTKTTLLCALSPSEFNVVETINTIRFGERAKTIKNKPRLNKMLSAAELQKLVDRLTRELEALKKYVASLEKAVDPATLEKIRKSASSGAAGSAQGASGAGISSSAEREIALQEAQAQMLQIKEQADVAIEDLREEVKFLTQRSEMAEAALAEQKRLAEASAAEADQVRKSCDDEMQRVSLERRKLEYSLAEKTSEAAELQAALRKLAVSRSASSGVLQPPHLSSETEEKLRDEIRELQRRSEIDIANVLEALNASESKTTRLEESLAAARTHCAKLQDALSASDEQCRLAGHRLALREEEIAALKASGHTTPPDFQAALARVESQLCEASQEHIQAAKMANAQTMENESKLRQELEQNAAALSERETAVPASDVAALRCEVADLRERLAAATAMSAAIPEASADVAELQEKLAEEEALRIVAESKAHQFDSQGKRLADVEAQLAQAIEEQSRLRQAEEVARRRAEELEKELESLKKEVEELRRANSLMLRRPSNKIFRAPTSGRGAYEALATRLDIVSLPSQLRPTNSTFLQDAKREADRDFQQRTESAAAAAIASARAALRPSTTPRIQTPKSPFSSGR